MMSGGCCGWGYSSWNCNWYHGGGVYYGGHPYYGNSAWHGGYYGNGYDNANHYNNGYNSSGYHADTTITTVTTAAAITPTITATTRT